MVDLAGINFSDFEITYSIYSKMCDEYNISGYKFLAKIGNFSNFTKLSIYPQTIVSLW